jgi:hypothetical protein
MPMTTVVNWVTNEVIAETGKIADFINDWKLIGTGLNRSVTFINFSCTGAVQ